MFEEKEKEPLYPWLKSQLAHWQGLRQNGRIPHAVMIKGMPGCGRKNLAEALAADLLCENPRHIPPATGATTYALGDDEAACGQCAGCQMLAAGTHPDCQVVMPEGQFIKVSQIRDISKKLALSAHRGGYKVAIIHSVGRMNPAAANALLKTLEEPPEKTCLILVSEESDRMLPTINSRCRPMAIKPPAASELAHWLKANDERVQLALTLAGGAPLQARKWLQQDRLEQFMAFVNQLAQLVQHEPASPATVTETANQWHEKVDQEWLSALTRYLLHFQALRAGLSRELSSDGPLVTLLGRFFTDNRLLIQKIQAVNALRQQMGGPLKKELLLEEFLINWKNNFQHPA